MVLIRKPYDRAVSDGFLSTDPSLTQQQFRDEADINYIVRAYDTTGVYPSINPVDNSRVPMFGDFTGVPESAQEAYNFILDAKANFDHLPLEIRKRFNYDPGEFLAFVEDPRNADELVRLGLAVKVQEDTVKEDKNTVSDEKKSSSKEDA